MNEPDRYRGDEVMDPRRTVLCVFDLLEHYRAAAESAGVIPVVRRLADGVRERGGVVAWARADHRADGLDFAAALSDLDGQHRPFGPDHPRPTRPPHGGGDPGYRTLAELGQQPEDLDVPKHRWSAGRSPRVIAASSASASSGMATCSWRRPRCGRRCTTASRRWS